MLIFWKKSAKSLWLSRGRDTWNLLAAAFISHSWCTWGCRQTLDTLWKSKLEYSTSTWLMKFGNRQLPSPRKLLCNLGLFTSYRVSYHPTKFYLKDKLRPNHFVKFISVFYKLNSCVYNTMHVLYVWAKKLRLHEWKYGNWFMNIAWIITRDSVHGRAIARALKMVTSPHHVKYS